jgi:hypothetical protein
MLLQDYARQEAIETLFNNGFLFIEADTKSINIKKPFKKEDLDTEQLRSYLDALNKFALGSSGIKNEKSYHEKYTEKRYNSRKLILSSKKNVLYVLLILILVISTLAYRNRFISRREEKYKAYNEKGYKALEEFVIAVKQASKNDTTALLELYELAANDSTYAEEASKAARSSLYFFLRKKTEFWVSTFSEVDQDKFKAFLREKGLDFSTSSKTEEKYKQETIDNLKKIKGNEKETELINYILKLIEENEK